MKSYPIKVEHENLKNLVGEQEISIKVHIIKNKQIKLSTRMKQKVLSVPMAPSLVRYLEVENSKTSCGINHDNIYSTCQNISYGTISN
jgi:hypothetical protein